VAVDAGSGVQKILVVRLSSLGDVVLTSSLLRSVAEHFPGAGIDFLVRDDLVEIATALPGVRRVIAVPRCAGPGLLAALAARLAHAGYAHVFDVHHSLRSRLLTARMRPKLRPGFTKQELPRWMLVHLHRDVYARFGGAVPLRARMLEPLRRMGFTPHLHDTQLVIPRPAAAQADRAFAAAGIHPDHEIVGIAPGARWASKRWPADRFAALVELLARDTGRRFVLVGAAGESGLGAGVAEAAPERSLDLCGALDVLGTAAVLARCRLLVTNDSGLLHVCEAVGRPVLAFFGSTSPRFGYAPYRPESAFLHRPPRCNPCSKNGSRPCHRPRHECMENISVDAAHAAASAILHRLQRARIASGLES
jgi:lipopolysaccharide heptosyltransferase II